MIDRLGGKWDPTVMAYRVPATIANLVELLQITEFSVSSDLFELLKTKDPVVPKIKLSNAWNNLYEFQKKEAWKLFNSNYPGHLLAIEPRLGKSIISIVTADLLNYENVLIISPRLLLRQWLREIREWTNRSPELCWGEDARPGWCVTTYESFSYGAKRVKRSLIPGKRTKSFQRYHWDLMIVDESVKIKSRDTVAFKSLFLLRKNNVDKVWELSGVPEAHNVSDLWTQFRLIWPDAFTSFNKFVERFCLTEDTPWGTTIVGSRLGMDFRYLFSDLMFTVTLEDTNGEVSLTELSFINLEVDMLPTQSKLYHEMLDTFIASVEHDTSVIASTKMSQLIRLQQILSCPANLGPSFPMESGKIDAVIECVEFYEKPVLIWTHWRRGATILCTLLRGAGHKVGFVIGGESNADEYIRMFQDGELDVLILSIDMGQYGLPLHNARTVVYMDKTYEMETYVQSLYRVKQMNPDHQPNVVSISVPGTVDELLVDNLTTKAVDLHHLTGVELASLLRSLKNDSWT